MVISHKLAKILYTVKQKNIINKPTIQYNTGFLLNIDVN